MGNRNLQQLTPSGCHDVRPPQAGRVSTRTERDRENRRRLDRPRPGAGDAVPRSCPIGSRRIGGLDASRPRSRSANVNTHHETARSLRFAPGVKPSVNDVIIGVMERTPWQPNRIPAVIRRNRRSPLSTIAGIRRRIGRRSPIRPAERRCHASRMFRIQSRNSPVWTSRFGGYWRRTPASARIRTVPRLQPLRNVAVFKSICVGFKTGVSSVTATSISSIQRPLPVRGRGRIGSGRDRSITGITAIYRGGRT